MMHSMSSKSPEDCHIFNNNLQNSGNLSDSGILEDMKESNEDVQFPSEIKYIRARTDRKQTLELPVDDREGNMKKRKLEESIPESSNILTPKEYLEKLSALQQLREAEKLLKTCIAYEQLRKEQPVLLDTDVIHEKIAEYKKSLQEAESEHKMKNIMCINLQLTNTLQKIVGKSTTACKQNEFSDSQRKCIKDLLKKKKESSRKIVAKRKEIAKIDEDILNLEKARLANNQKSSQKIADVVLSSSHIEKDDLDELERLEENNTKVIERVRLLSQIVQSLAAQTADESDLSDLIMECEKVSKCQFEDKGDINALLTSVCSVNLS